MACRIKRQLVEVSSLLPCVASFIDLKQLLLLGAGDHGCRNEGESLRQTFHLLFLCISGLFYFVLLAVLETELKAQFIA